MCWGKEKMGRQKVSKQTNKYIMLNTLYELENCNEDEISGLLMQIWEFTSFQPLSVLVGPKELLKTLVRGSHTWKFGVFLALWPGPETCIF